MKSKIEELSGKALDKIVPYTWTTLDYEEIKKLQKYLAELIIQESCQVLLNWKDEPFPFDENLAVRLLKEHFNLE
jgi:hypothetical protein